MSKTLKTLLFVCLLAWLTPSLGQGKASDFFKNPSKEKDLLKSLFDSNDKKRRPDRPFSLDGELGVLKTTGNTDTSMIKLALDSTHEMKDWSNRYEGQFLQRNNKVNSDSAAGGTITNKTTRFAISGQFDYKLTEDTNRLFAYFEYDDNQFNSLRDQIILVTGWSQVMWKEPTSEFRYSIGPGYSHFKQETNDALVESMIVRGTMLYGLRFSKHSRFRQEFSAEIGDHISKVRSQSSVTATVFKKLAMKLSFNIVLNESVADVDKVLSTQTSVSMVYQFF